MKQRIRYVKTFLHWSWYNISKKFVKKHPLILFIIFGITALTLYLCSIPLNQSKLLIEVSTWIANLIGIKNVYDSFIIKVFTTILGSLTIIISLLSAIYVFTYREQKSVSPSASTDSHKNNLVIFVICIIIFNIVYGSFIITEFNRLLNESEYTPSLFITKHLYSKIILLCITISLLIYLIVRLVNYLFRTMSVDRMLEDSVEQTSNLFDLILYAHRSDLYKELLADRYKKLHYSLESVFQNLKFAAENNMNKEFSENIATFKKVIEKFNQTSDKYDIGNVSTYLLKQDETKFLFVYISALRSNFSLITTLMKNQQYKKAKEVVSLYFYMYISEDTLKKVFQISLNDYLDIIDVSDERQLLIFLDGLSGIPQEQTLITNKFLLMKLINKNELKNLTNLVYAYKKHIENPLLKNSSIVILLQNLIKSIEISNYQITGFLVKFLITNISGKDLNKGLMILKRNKSAFTSVLEADEIIEGISENGSYAIKINDETFDYCYKKAYVLLFAQHIYSLRNDLWYTKKRKEIYGEIKLREEFEGCSYSEYILTKVKVASGKYGLLFFDDTDVMIKIHNELNLNYPDSGKVIEQTLPETIS